MLAMQPAEAQAKGEKTSKPVKQLVVLHTNDTHSCVMPINPNLADTAMANRGGYLRRVAMIKEERKVHPDLLLFDSGDFSQGSPYYSLFKGDVVCANYDFTGTELASIVKPYVILHRQGVKIGVFGLCPELKGLVSEANYGVIKYENPVEKGREMAEFLKKKEKCDVIICLSHLGWDVDGDDDTEMIPGSRYIDLVLGGHSHTYFKDLQYVKDLDGKPVPVDQNGKSAIWVGKMVLDLSKK